MPSLNRKAISPLIATVIIISITVAAGITLFALVLPLISNPGGTSCTDVSFVLDPVSCVDPNILDGNLVKMSIDRTKSSLDEPDIVGWTLVLDAGFGERRSVSIDEATFKVDAGAQSTHSELVDSSILAELRGDVNRISAYPTIDVRGTQVTCEAIQQTVERLKICAGSGSQILTCFDNTPVGECSLTLDPPNWCNPANREFIDNCVECPCIIGICWTSDPSSGSCTCTDGTRLDACSITLPPPSWCNPADGELAPNCNKCGCPVRDPPFVCNQITGTCDPPIGGGGD